MTEFLFMGILILVVLIFTVAYGKSILDKIQDIVEYYITYSKVNDSSYSYCDYCKYCNENRRCVSNPTILEYVYKDTPLRPGYIERLERFERCIDKNPHNACLEFKIRTITDFLIQPRTECKTWRESK